MAQLLPAVSVPTWSRSLVCYRFIKKTPLHSWCLDAAGVLGDSFGPLRHGVPGEFPWENQSHRGLDVSAVQGRSTTVLGKPGRLRCQSLKHVDNKRIDDSHGAGGHPHVWVYIFHYPVDEDFERFFSFLHILGFLFLDRLRRGTFNLGYRGCLSSPGRFLSFRRHLVTSECVASYTLHDFWLVA